MKAINPLLVIVGKQKVGQADADAIALPVLLSLDAAKRGLAPASLCNCITQHLLIACVIWTKLANKPMYDRSVAAWNAMVKACARPTNLLDLTTGEYKAIRTALSYYLRALPKVEVGTLSYAFKTALATLNEPNKE